MKFILKAYSIWEYGQRKDSHGNPHQEDSLAPAFGEQTDSDRLFVLCDGMGGHAAGEVASAEVCKAMTRYIKANCPDPEGDCPMFVIIDAVNAAFDALDACNSLATRSMGTTMTLLKLHSHGATIAHIGDSRVYHIRPGKTAADTVILHKTQDHSLVNDLLRNGKITPEEARAFPRKNIITRAMQPMLKERPEAEYYRTADIRPGDFFYLCSDGMLEQDDMNYGQGIQQVFSGELASDPERVAFLRGITVNNRDNHTAFIIHILKVIPDGSEQKPEEPQVEASCYEDEPVEVTPDDDTPAVAPISQPVAPAAPVPRPVAPTARPQAPANRADNTPVAQAVMPASQSKRVATPTPMTNVVTSAPRQAMPTAAPQAPRQYSASPQTQHTVVDPDDQSFFDKFSDYLNDIFKAFGITNHRVGAIIVGLVLALLILTILVILFKSF
ncbi:MAG: protein phosphatase 2C domain-containing protein [Muribaculaceae bacterium]